MKSYYPAPLMHYHGDVVRRLFFAAAIIVLIGLPFFNNRLPIHTIVSLVAIVGVGLFSGLTSPLKRWPVLLDVFISVIGTLVFEYYAVAAYETYSFTDALFWVNQILAIIFVVALYYSAKTFRAMILE